MNETNRVFIQDETDRTIMELRGDPDCIAETLRLVLPMLYETHRFLKVEVSK